LDVSGIVPEDGVRDLVRKFGNLISLLPIA